MVERNRSEPAPPRDLLREEVPSMTGGVAVALSGI